MDAGAHLLRLCLVLVAARVAAEIAERASIPAVLAEIAAGVVLGPSVLAAIGPDLSLSFLAELGAILLLFEVGLHMDIEGLRRVGRASLQVAAIGVAVPFVVGFFAMRAMGVSGTVAMFLAAGITATSVGITARVFADMRALATAEARTVLGAAVADDVIGLLILTVVVRFSAGESVSTASTILIACVAIGFVVVAAAVGTWIVPRVLARVHAVARTDGTLTTLALAFAIGLGSLAASARLAPIVGSFVAGVALAGSPIRDEVARRMAPVGHVLVPVFFLMIGTQTSLQSFGDPWVLRVGAVLTAVGVIGKIVAGLGVRRGSADRMLVGVGMIPRGEVGLIFASIGLAKGILDARSQAVLLLVVLVTTVATPPWIRRRLRAATALRVTRATVAEPAGGWLIVTDAEVELSAEPPAPALARVGLEAAVACDGRRPGPRLLASISMPLPPPVWDEALRARFFSLLRDGGVQSWRFLEVSGLLVRILPELDVALRRRMRDPFSLDPTAPLRWEILEDVKRLPGASQTAATAWARLQQRDIVLLAALARSAFEGPDAGRSVTALAATMNLEETEAELLGFLVAERHLLPAAASRLDLGREDAVLELVAHFRSSERASGLFLLALAEASGREQRQALEELWGLVRAVLQHPEMAGPDGMIETRRAAVLRALGGVPEPGIRRLLEEAPRRYILAQSPATVARHLRMIDQRLRPEDVRIHAERSARGRFDVDLFTRDRAGALARITGVFSRCDITVEQAVCTTWPTGFLIDTFKVEAADGTDWERVREQIVAAFGVRNGLSDDPIDGIVHIDNVSSPWYSIVEVQAVDRTGVLYRVASALARAGAHIHQATVHTVDGVAVDMFAVSGPTGHRLDADGERALRAAFAGHAPRARRALLRGRQR